jgi:hypothetical protein
VNAPCHKVCELSPCHKVCELNHWQTPRRGRFTVSELHPRWPADRCSAGPLVKPQLFSMAHGVVSWGSGLEHADMSATATVAVPDALTLGLHWSSHRTAPSPAGQHTPQSSQCHSTISARTLQSPHTSLTSCSAHSDCSCMVPNSAYLAPAVVAACAWCQVLHT